MATSTSKITVSLTNDNILTMGTPHGNGYCLKKNSKYYTGKLYYKVTRIVLYDFDGKAKKTTTINKSHSITVNTGKKKTDENYWYTTTFSGLNTGAGSGNQTYSFYRVYFEIRYKSASGTLIYSSSYTGNLVILYNKPKNAPSISIDTSASTIKVSASGLADDQPKTPTYASVQLYSTTNGTKYTAYGIKTTATIKDGSASWVIKNISKGRAYKAAVYVQNSAASDYSDVVSHLPLDVSNITSLKADSATQVTLSWSVPTGYPAPTEYTVERTADNWNNFTQNPSAVSSTTVSTNKAIITGLDSAHTYYFRVCAKNSVGSSGWTGKNGSYYIKVGTVPTAPTPYIDSTTALDDPTVTTSNLLNTFRWIHNCEDNSEQQAAQIAINYYVQSSGSWTLKSTETFLISNNVNYYDFYNTKLTSGSGLNVRPVMITMKVRTKGFMDSYSDYSAATSFIVYDKAEVSSITLSGGSPAESFPLVFTAETSNKGQKVINTQWILTANDNLTLTNPDGSTKDISSGSTVWSDSSSFTAVDTSTWTLTLTAGTIALDTSNARYRIYFTVTFDTGVSATGYYDFTINVVDDDTYMVDADFEIDEDNIALKVYPNMLTDTGADEYTPYVLTDCLTVYRKSHDGELILIADSVDSGVNMMVTDKHPSLDYAEYRIVAITPAGNIIYDDISYTGDDEGNAIDTAVIIQWDEDADNVSIDYSYEVTEASDDEEVTESTGDGNSYSTLLRLPYDIQISEDYGIEKELVSYVGRSHPVSYYGTQRNHTATWQVDVPKSDTQTITAIRHLAAWQGDVYVREPNGSGYWANITVSFNINYSSLVVPVSFKITHVEGDA